MPFIALPIAIGIAGMTGLYVSVAAVEVGLFVLGIAGLGALSIAMKPNIPGDTGPLDLSGLNNQVVKGSVKQSTPFQRIGYGPQRFGGAFSFYRSPEGSGKLIVQHMYSRRKITQFTALNVNGNRLIFGATPFNTILTPLIVPGQPDYAGKLRVCFQAGTIDQPTNPLLLANYPDLPPGWRLPGTANGVYEFSFGADVTEHTALWGNTQIPDMQPEALLAPVYDPRDPTQYLPANPNDPLQWFAAQESWKYSDNAALIAADYLWQPDGINAGPGGVRWDKVAESANRADEACATRNGVYERRYTAAGFVGLDQNTASVFDGIMTASRSCLVQGFDGCWPESDAPKPSVFTITDDMIIGAVTYRGFKARRDLANQTTMRFVDPAQQGQLTDGPPLIRADLINADGEPIPLTVNLPFTPSSSTAQRIAKADLLDARIEASADGSMIVSGGATWSSVIDLRGLGLRENDCVTIASEICPHWNGRYIADAGKLVINLRGDSGMALSLVGYDETNCNNWDVASDDQAFVPADTETLLAA